MRQSKTQKDHLIHNSPWKEFISNTNYAFDPYGETDEKVIPSETHTNTTYKEKPYHGHVERSTHHEDKDKNQMTALPITTSPRNKSQTTSYPEPHGHANQYVRNGSSNNNMGPDHHHDPRNKGTSRAERSRVMDRDRSSYTERDRSSYTDRAYSLPRPLPYQTDHHPSGYYTQDRRDRRRNESRVHTDGYAVNSSPAYEQRQSYNNQRRSLSREDPRLKGGAATPDFYFMPSQRKYSGEVVRVYVDYNNDPKF